VLEERPHLAAQLGGRELASGGALARLEPLAQALQEADEQPERDGPDLGRIQGGR
jgi:hypothetical protein